MSDYSIKISIVVVNYNGQRWLPDCLRSISKQSFKSLEVIFVDNNSADDSLGIVKKYYPSAKIIKNKSNTGFGLANNLGAKVAKGEFLFFLNTDTKLRPNCLSKMIKTMTSEKIDLAGPKLLDFHGNDFYRSRKLTLDIVGNLSWGKKTTMIEGCALLIKREVFNHLGGFEPSFFMYSEDLDLCWRAFLLGYKTKLIKTAVVNHYGGGSSLPTMIGNQRHQVPVIRRYETEKNTLRMMIKNASVAHLLLSVPLITALISGEALLYLLTGQFHGALYLFRSLKWNIVHIGDTLKLRSVIQNSKTKYSMWPFMAKKITKFEVFKLIGIPSIKG